MKSKLGFLFFTLWMISINIIAQGVYIQKSNDIRERDNKQYYVHTVSKGQTVYSIAKAYDVSVDEIYYENPESKSGLQIGQQLWIPTINKEREITTEVSAANFDFFYHIANENERFSSLAKLYNIPERYILLANKGLNEPLKEGEYVKIPVEAAFATLDGKSTKPYTEPYISYIPPPPTNNANRADIPITTEKPYNYNQNDVSFNPNIKVMENYRHVVISGESIASVAAKYQITVSDLKSVNPGLSEIVKGDRLRIPAYSKIPGVHQYKYTPSYNKKPQTRTQKQAHHNDKSSIYFKYSVKSGENLYIVAKNFGVSLETLYKLNPSLSGTKLFKGQVIKITKLQKKPRYIYYQVHRKTRLKKIAKLFSISYAQIKYANPRLKKRVYAGQTVKIPGGSKAVLITAQPEINNTGENITLNTKPTKYRCQPKPYRGKVYKIALMIPMFLEEMDSINSEDFHKTFQPQFKSFRFIDFLEGAFIAIDSLKQMGYNLEFNVYDVDNQITKTVKILQRPELKDMDLIIGPFYSKSFNQVALFAENFNIPVINPFTYREEILGKYKNVIKVKPGISSHIPLLAKLIKNRYSDYKIFLITQNSYKDADIVTQLKTSLTEAVSPFVRFSNVDINNLSIEVDSRLDEDGAPLSPYYNLEGNPIDPAIIAADLYDSTTFSNRLVAINYLIDSLHPFLDQASTLRKNLIIIYGDDKPFIMDAINQLNRVRDTFDIELVGIPLWEEINNMDYMLLNNLNLTYFSSSYINYNEQRTQQFISTFINMFNTEPDNFGFSGFDITLFFVKTLADYGKRFTKCLPFTDSRAFENGFKFEKVKGTDNNFENIMWNIIQINDYKTIRLPESNLIPVGEEK